MTIETPYNGTIRVADTIPPGDHEAACPAPRATRASIAVMNKCLNAVGTLGEAERKLVIRALAALFGVGCP